MQSPIIYSNQILITLEQLGIPESAYADKYIDMMGLSEMLNEIEGFTETLINTYVNANLVVNAGDIIYFIEKPYRNSTKGIWYDNCIHDLDNEVDEYGALPKVESFFVNPGSVYHPRYWNKSIRHNGYYYVCDEYIKECTENIHKIRDRFYGKILITHFTHNGCMETVVFNPDTIEDYKTLSLKTLKNMFIERLKTKLFDIDHIGFDYEGYDDFHTSLV